jgi:hypothetical protein
MYAACATRALTETRLLVALRLHTQITKLALSPGLTSRVGEKDCTRTHNCGVFGLGAGDAGEVLGVGVGPGVLELELGSGRGAGVELVDCDDGELSVGDGAGLPLGDGLAESVGDAVGRSLGDGLEVSDGPCGDDVRVPAPLLAGLLVILVAAALSTAVVGGKAQGLLTAATGMTSACAARDSPNMAKPRMVNPVSAPAAVRLLVRAITAATSLQSGSRAGAGCPRCVS